MIPDIPELDDSALLSALQTRIDGKTKPLGSLGRLEALAIQIGCILGSASPRLHEPQLVVFAADHGLAVRGVSAYPSDVTWQMAENFLAGGAAVSVLARQHGLALTVVDAGVRHDFAPRAGLQLRKIGAGTADALAGSAMSQAQCSAAIAAGREVVQALPGNALLLGEMGIGNTSAAALLLARLCGQPIERCTGRGTGLDDAGLAHKQRVLGEVLARHAAATTPLAALAAFGGDGFGEIGAAQYFQALAARVAPTVDMNPVLLKPERDTASQVVLQGRAADDLSRLPWRERSTQLAVAARESFLRLHAQHELLVIEGAGSPAEINLAPQDYVNLGTARWAQAAGALQSLLVTDIDRGGAFAHLYGTWALLPDDLKATVAGFVLNKFRGDASLLAPGPAHLQQLTGVPVVGVLPMRRDHGLPDEDGVFDAGHASECAAPSCRVAVLAYPRISNLDEFQPLRQVPGLRLTWARHAAELEAADWIILPGSKQVSGDLQWLRELNDPHGVDGAPGCVPGLGLLPLNTRYAAPKRVLAVQARFGELQPPWQALSGIDTPAYEIRTGITEALDGREGSPLGTALSDGQGTVIGWQRGPVLGVYAHGLFESAAVMRALFGAEVATLEASLDRLADLVDRHVEPGVLMRCLHA